MQQIFRCPAGVYFIGDPCYAFDESWSKILEDTQYFGATAEPPIPANEFDVLGHRCFVGSTFHGDSCYQDNYRFDYPVDAGVLALLPVALLAVDEKMSIADVNEYGRVITFGRDFDVTYEDGIFIFGHLRIDTREEEGQVVRRGAHAAGGSHRVPRKLGQGPG